LHEVQHCRGASHVLERGQMRPEPDSQGPRSWFWREPFRSVPRTLIIRARKEGI